MPIIEGKSIVGALKRPWENDGAPTDGVNGTLADIAEKGDLLIDKTNANLYQNTNTQASPTWTVITAGGVSYGTSGQMAASGTNTANAAGSIAAASRIDHVHALGAHIHSGATTGGQIGPSAFASDAFTSDGTGRAPFQDGIWTTAKLAPGFISADAPGRALIAANFFDAATAENKFADSSIPSDKVNWGFGGAPTTIEPDASGAAGSAGTPSRSDHRHGIVAAAPSDGTLAAANAEGSSTSFARADHAHRAVVLDGVEIEFGTGYDAVLGWETGDADNHTLVLGLDDANQALHIADKSAIGTDWNVGADTHPSIYVHSDTTPATDYIKMFHDASNGWLRSVGGNLNIDAPTGSTVNACINGSVEVSISATSVDLNGNHIDNSGYIILNEVALPAGTEDYIARDNAGDININAITGKQIIIQIAGNDEYNFGASSLLMHDNNINMGNGYINFGTNPAIAGDLRMPNNSEIWQARNQANDADIVGWKVNISDEYEAAVDVNLAGNELIGSTVENGDLVLLATSHATETTSYILAEHMFDGSSDGVATKVVAGAVGDGSFTGTAINGLLAVDSTNGRLYFRYGAAWHYVDQTA